MCLGDKGLESVVRATESKTKLPARYFIQEIENLGQILFRCLCIRWISLCLGCQELFRNTALGADIETGPNRLYPLGQVTDVFGENIHETELVHPKVHIGRAWGAPYATSITRIPPQTSASPMRERDYDFRAKPKPPAGSLEIVRTAAISCRIRDEKRRRRQLVSASTRAVLGGVDPLVTPKLASDLNKLLSCGLHCPGSGADIFIRGADMWHVFKKVDVFSGDLVDCRRRAEGVPSFVYLELPPLPTVGI